MIISECELHERLTAVVLETYETASWAEGVRAHGADAPAPTSGPLQGSDETSVNAEVQGSYDRSLKSGWKSVPRSLCGSQPLPLSARRLPPPGPATRGTSPGER